MIVKTAKITNKLGLHARAASKLVATASRFSCEITISKDSHEANAKSILGVMTLAAALGAEIQLVANGEDEAVATQEILSLLHDKFGEAE